MHFKPTWATLIFCLLIGVSFVVLAVSIVSGNPILVQIMNSTGLVFLNRIVLELGSGSMTLQVGALILVIGLSNLIRTLVVATPKSP